MNHAIKVFSGLVLRAVLLLMGLVFFAGILAATLLLLAAWLARALWARLTGRPVAPWVVRFNRQAPWDRFYRAAAPGRAARRDQQAEVIDVEPKAIRPPDARTEG